MNFRLYLLIYFAFSLWGVKAQVFKIGFQAGCGFYNMSSLKEFTENKLETLPFEAKILSNYPPYFYYKPVIKYYNKDYYIGFVYLFQTTGSRISLKDYSGEYRFDTKINCYSPGLIFNGLIRQNKKIMLAIYLQGGINYSVLKMTEYIEINNETNANDNKLKAKSAYFEPGFNFIYPKNRMDFELHVGYYKEFARNDYVLEGSSGSYIPVKKGFFESDIWDGFRIGLTFSYPLSKKKDNN